MPETGRFQIWKTDDQTGDYLDRNQGIWIEPGKRPYTGPIAVLIDNGCISSCEGVAMGLSRLPNATLVGFYGTNGSFGMVGDGVLMPEASRSVGRSGGRLIAASGSRSTVVTSWAAWRRTCESPSRSGPWGELCRGTTCYCGRLCGSWRSSRWLWPV